MQLVIADTGPINYLILIGHIDILPALFDKVILPFAVRDELAEPKAPPLVRRWLAGTLGVLAMAAERGLLNLSDAFDRIKRTSFHYRQDLIDQFLSEQRGKA